MLLAVTFWLILTAVCEKSQSNQKYQSVIRIYLPTPAAKEKLLETAFLRLLPRIRMTEARFGEESAVRGAPTLKACLKVGPLVIHLGLFRSCLQSWDRRNLCTYSPTLPGCLQSLCFSSPEPE